MTLRAPGRADECPPRGASEDDRVRGPDGPDLKERLHGRFFGVGHPLLLSAEAVLPAASLWAGARLWLATARDAGLGPGDGIAADLSPGSGLAQLLLAALWERWDLTLVPPDLSAPATLDLLEARGIRACITERPLPDAWPVEDGLRPGPVQLRAPHATSAGGWWVEGPVPRARILAALDATPVPPRLRCHHDWRTRRGLLTELLPGLMHADELFYGEDDPFALAAGFEGV